MTYSHGLGCLLIKGRCLTIFFIFCMASSGLSTATNAMSSTTYNVMSYGAFGDGKTDDSQAFLKAWKAACQAQRSTPILLIPWTRTFLLKPVTFNGPCKSSHVFVQVSGNIVAPNKKSAWIGHHTNTWLAFLKINGLFIDGPGQIDGQGSVWWPQPCLQKAQNVTKCNAPTALSFNRCNNLELKGLTHINSPRRHLTITNCNGVLISNLRIVAPETSPNTDGIDISGSTNLQIRNCNIGTGDDCIALSGGSSNISITNVTCGPGHGISIGALGHGGYDAVEEVHVQNCTFKGTMNGVRIKSWQGGTGYARKISFDKIKLIGAGNPIIIDQFYCPSRINCQNKTLAIELSDISYSGIEGTSTSENVINLSCSQSFGCTNISLDYVHITSETPRKRTYTSCFNAHGRSSHTQPSVNCLM